MILRKISILLLALVLFSFSADKGKKHYIGDAKIYYGAAYYPEAWDLKTLDEDIAYMKKAGMNVMRMAEFSWALMEPVEGEFDFEWLHRVVDKLHENDIDVVLGTPTATPPAWFAEKHPDALVMEENGVRRQHGARRNYSYLHPVYIEKSRIICEQMAKEFGQKKGVIAWQTDNEFHLDPDYSEHSENEWHRWLTIRYGHIDTLNKKWNTVLWSQVYGSFDQVPMPKSNTWHHPSLRLSWYRFWNENIDQYQDVQIKAIRKYSDLPITHDGMPGQKTDYEKLFGNLDFMAVNNYHSFEAYDRIQSNYDRMRGFDKGMYWLFETAPNYSGGGSKGNTWFLHQPEGSFRAAMWMNYALGGQGAMFWLFRQHKAGHEMPHGSIISSWGKPAANFNDIAALGTELAEKSKWLIENQVKQAKAAIYWSHENLIGLNIEEYANGIHYYIDWTYRFYRPLADAYIHRDVVNPGANIDEYKLLLMPLMPFIPQETKEKLKEWVANGGILVLGPMSGYRNEEWASFTNHALGDFGKWTGIEVESRIPVGTERREAEIPLMLNFKGDDAFIKDEAGLWSEALSTQNGQVLAVYETGMHHGLPAIIENKVGKGKVVYLGADPGYENYKAIALKYASEAGISPLAEGDKNCIVVERTNGKASSYIVVNIENQKRTLRLKNGNVLDLEPYEIVFEAK